MDRPVNLSSPAAAIAGAGSGAEVVEHLSAALEQVLPDRSILSLSRTGARHDWRVMVPREQPASLLALPDLPSMGDAGRLDLTKPGIPAEWKGLEAVLGSRSLEYMAAGRRVLILAGDLDEGPTLSDSQPAVLLTQLAATAMEKIELRREVDELALLDPETGLPTERYVRAVMDRYIAAARRGEPLSVVLIGIEGAAAPGQGRGADALSPRLRTAAKLVLDVVRDSDLVAAYGTDQVLAALPRCSQGGAKRVLHRIRQRAGEAVAFRAGVAEFGSSAGSLDEMLLAAGDSLERTRRFASA